MCTKTSVSIHLSQILHVGRDAEIGEGERGQEVSCSILLILFDNQSKQSTNCLGMDYHTINEKDEFSIKNCVIAKFRKFQIRRLYQLTSLWALIACLPSYFFNMIQVLFDFLNFTERCFG